MSLKIYRRKRKFTRTPEPSADRKPRASKGALRFVVQKHAASRTHYDFRLEIDGALKSWAVPRGPSLTSGDPRLAVRVEDHPMEYGEFEGVIPKGNYGAGTVMIWDSGTFVERGSTTRAESEKALKKGLSEGHLTFVLDGKKLQGEFALVKIKKKGAEENAWLLVKKHDAHASRVDITRESRSVASGRTMEEIAAQAPGRGEIWLPGKGRSTEKASKAAAKAKLETKTKAKAKAAPSVPTVSSMPRHVRPMEPVFATSVPEGADWIFEAFGDGVRSIAEVEKGRVRLYSRTFLPLEKKHAALVERLESLKHSAVLDGEILTRGSSPIFVVTDLLFLDGKDLRALPLRDRKKQLEKLGLPKGIERARTASSLAALSLPPMAKAVAKRADSAYRNGLSRDWLRLRVTGSRLSRPIASEKPPITHPDKVFWPEEGYTKGDLVAYYEKVAEALLPHLVDRPQSLHRQPDGLRNEGFFHKDMTSFLPRRIQTERVYSGSSGRTINYALCQDKWSLLYLVNLGCIELNPWLSRRGQLESPDFVVIDLDPDDNDFREVVKVARAVHALLESIGAKSYCKTSGSTGLHICVPTGAKFPYEACRLFAEAVCRAIHEKFPKTTSVERNPARRRGLIYLDFLQNRRGQTLAAPYCVRPRPGAPVSAPLKWTEVTPKLRPEHFTIENLPKRLAKLGDLWKPLLTESVDIEACHKRLSKRRHD